MRVYSSAGQTRGLISARDHFSSSANQQLLYLAKLQELLLVVCATRSDFISRTLKEEKGRLDDVVVILTLAVTPRGVSCGSHV